MKVTYFGPESGTSLHRVNGFKRLGHDVTVLDPRRMLPASHWYDRIEWRVSPWLLALYVHRAMAAALAGSQFDLAFVDSGSLVSRSAIQTIRKHCRKVVNFNHDDPFGGRDHRRWDVYLQALPAYDLVVVVRQVNVAEARGRGARTILLRTRVADEVAHAPRVLSPGIASQWQSDVAFIGTCMPDRSAFLCGLVERGVPLAIYGPNWRKAKEWSSLARFHRSDYLDGDQYAYAVQCAKVSLGLLSSGNRDLHTTRSLEIPSLGGVFCAQRTVEHQSMYQDGIEALLWDGATECAEQCHRLLADEQLRRNLAERGRQRFLQDGNTTEHLLKTVTEAVGLA